MIEAILIICSILSLSPVQVDCDNEWTIVFYDQEYIDTPYSIQAKGYAWYEDQRNYGVVPFLTNGRIINAGIGNGTLAEDGAPIIWHELNHLICKCAQI